MSDSRDLSPAQTPASPLVRWLAKVAASAESPVRAAAWCRRSSSRSGRAGGVEWLVGIAPICDALAMLARDGSDGVRGLVRPSVSEKLVAVALLVVVVAAVVVVWVVPAIRQVGDASSLRCDGWRFDRRRGAGLVRAQVRR